MNQMFKKSVSLMLAIMMVVGVFATTVLAANDYTINSTVSTDNYYNLITKTDWDIAPGITESEIILNNDDITRRQVIHVMEANLNNPYTKVIASYAEMNTSKYQTATMDVQAAWVEENWGLNVVGAMNTCLSWYSGDSADQVGRPLGFMMVDGEVLWDRCEGFPTVLVINKDFDSEGNARPTSIPKVEMIQIRTTADLDGWEEQVIPCSSGFIVKDGVNQYTPNHSDAAPRSVVGIKADGTVVIMENDGRQSPFSIGMSMYELAEVMLDLGCSYAVNCDGGGSSTFLSQRPGEELEVNNSPSDGGLRPTTQGILFISTAPSDGTFVRASVEAESQYYTPESKVQFTAKGADIAGGAAEIPAEAVWQLSADSASLGTIDQNGLFISNGATGEITAQLVYNGEVCGECTVNIVIPDALVFSQSTLTVPNGESTQFSVTAMYGLIEVTSKPSDYTLALSSADMGTLNGFVLNATEDTDVKGGAIVATLTYDTSVTATMQVVFGKASEVIFDFENGFGDSWYVEQVQKRKNWSKTNKTSHYNIVVDNYAVNADTGMVHNGYGAGAVYTDNTYATLNWSGAGMYWNQETVTYENVSSIGVWVYIPKDAVGFAVRFILTGIQDGKKVSIDAYPHNFGDSLYFEESGWKYCSVDVSAYDAIVLERAPAFENVNNDNRYNGFRIELTCQLNGGSSGEYDWVTTPGVKSINTFYVDDLTIDYSAACDDREAPIFGEVAYVEPVTSEDKYLNNQRKETTVTNYNNIGFSVSVAEDTTKLNATGLDDSSIKAYIDGNEVDFTFNGKNIAVDSLNLTNGVHTVKFTACDKSGNYASVVRKINVNVENNDCGIKIVPKVDMDMAFTGSQYWVDVVVDNAENVDKVSLTLDLNNVNFWLTERIETLYGFEISYKTDIAGENLLYLTITRTENAEATGEAVLASIPVQTWEWKEEDYPGYLPSAGGDNDLNGNSMYDPYEQWKEYVTTNMDIIINPTEGIVYYVDGTNEWFSGEKIQVDTEQKIGTWWGCSKENRVHFADKSSWHLHIAGNAQNLDATCTENGYIGRVFCTGCACVTEKEFGHVCDSHNGCGAVLDWGTVVPATGHDYDVVDGKLACINGGELFNGTYTDGKFYVDGVVIADGWNSTNTSYYVDGVKLVGSHCIDKTVYTFDENGIYDPDYLYTGFMKTENGWMYFTTNVYRTGFVVIDGAAHYFRSNGYAPVGQHSINGGMYYFEGEQGKIIYGEITTSAGKRLYYSHRYYMNTWVTIGENTYYCDNGGYVQVGTRAISHSGVYLGAYEFDADGVLVGNITGVFKDSATGVNHYAVDGVLFNGGLVEWNGGYYYARSNYSLATGKYYVSSGNGILPAGAYEFDENGKMIIETTDEPEVPAVKNGIVSVNGVLGYYVDDVKQYGTGLVEWNGGYYYVRSNGNIVTGKYYVSNGNGLMPEGKYEFDENGKMIIETTDEPEVPAVKNGIVNVNGVLGYYVDDVKQYGTGIVEWNGGYYYVRSNGNIVTGKYYVSNGNGLMPEGKYEFDENGKMIIETTEEPDTPNVPEVKNGIVNVNGVLGYYVNDVKQYGTGLVEWNGGYYYVRSNGAIVTGRYYVSNGNGFIPEGKYEFDEEGKLIGAI